MTNLRQSRLQEIFLLYFHHLLLIFPTPLHGSSILVTSISSPHTQPRPSCVGFNSSLWPSGKQFKNCILNLFTRRAQSVLYFNPSSRQSVLTCPTLLFYPGYHVRQFYSSTGLVLPLNESMYKTYLLIHSSSPHCLWQPVHVIERD